MRWLTTACRLLVGAIGFALGIVLVGFGGVHLFVRDPVWLAAFAAIIPVGLAVVLFSGRYAWRTVAHRA